MIIELYASLVIQTQNIKETYANLGDNNNIHQFIPGDSLVLREQRERDLAEQISRINRQTIAREKNERASRGLSTGTGGIATKLYQDFTNNCAVWAKRQTGITHPIGFGGRASIQGQEPKVGAIGVEKGRPHAVVIKSIEGDKIIIEESNFIKGWISTRTLSRSSFIGYIYN